MSPRVTLGFLSALLVGCGTTCLLTRGAGHAAPLPARPQLSFDMILHPPDARVRRENESRGFQPSPLTKLIPEKLADNPILLRRSLGVVRVRNVSDEPFRVIPQFDRIGTPVTCNARAAVETGFHVEAEVRKPDGSLHEYRDPIPGVSAFMRPRFGHELLNMKRREQTLDPHHGIELLVKDMFGGMWYLDDYRPGRYTVRAKVRFAQMPDAAEQVVFTNTVPIVVTQAHIDAAKAFEPPVPLPP